MTGQAPVKDPRRSFRGVMAGGLILEAIVVALALLVVARLGSGFASVTGWLVLAVVVALLATCALLRYRWSIPLTVALQLVLVGVGFDTVAIGIVGGIFLVVWVAMLVMRADVVRRYDQGRLPAQQAADDEPGD